MRTSNLGALLVLSAILLGVRIGDSRAEARVDIATALANAVHPKAVTTTPVSDTIFANGFDNAGGQCVTAPDCPAPASQCSLATCTEGICGTSNSSANTPCTSGGYCTGGSCVCDNSGSCTTTCTMADAGQMCAPSPDVCHSPGFCNGQFCEVFPLNNGTICGFGQYCQNGVCM